MADEKLLRIATRESPLALWQAGYIKSRLEDLHADLQVKLVGMTSRGDTILDVPLTKVGGKGLFVKELETALLNHTADMAVHSMKDVPMEFPLGLKLGVICEREDPRDAFVSNQYAALSELPAGSIVGTSSLRRECQLRAARPDLEVNFLRGNVNTRLAKLNEGQYDAILLACAGLVRLGMSDRIRQRLSVEQSLPAGGQGAVGIELRDDDEETAQLIAPLADTATSICVSAERAMNLRLNGGCQVPIAGYAELDPEDPERVFLRGLVGRPDGSEILRAEGRGYLDSVEALGMEVADALLRQGAGDILAESYG